QKEIPVRVTDTGESLYAQGVEACLQLFSENLDRLFSLDLQPIPQSDGVATYHHSSEIEKHSEIRLDKEYRAEELINILRGRTFWEGNSAYFVRNGKKYFLKLKIENHFW